ncbi:MAG TPA: metallopeptidase family protein [Solirubrobacteraceae bacterium]|jgi:predicted Zn-dependent protease with MMP-like domain|nr:metallopeptidase family protein [Solirubrobacteraceae bacterium]
MPPAQANLKTIGRALAGGFFVALLVAVIASPPSHSTALRVLELVAIVVLGLIVLAAIVELISARLAGWHESEQEFELTVQRSERLASSNLAADPDEVEFMELDPLDDSDFEELVRDALDELPDLLQNALRHVAVVISSGGRKAGLYGLYQGDGGRRDNHPDRIVIFRDSLRRDFGGDGDALREQVTRTVRHELAHHVGFDELGVRDLGL